MTLVPLGTPLQHALDVAATSPHATTIRLAPGVHRLRHALQLTKEHRQLRIVGEPNATISGGAVVTGWKRSTRYPHLVQASVGKIIEGMASWPRNLWVNDRRAARGSLSGGSFTMWAAQNYTVTDNGYAVATTLPWPDPSSVEMVYTAQGSQWTESRCTVAAVEPRAEAARGGVLVRMQQPCWFNLVHKPCGQGTSRVAQIENVGVEYLKQGEWYLDHPAKMLYYWPLPHERVSTLAAVLPVADGLIHAAPGAAHLSFENVTFEHDGWSLVNGPNGYVEQQSGALIANDPAHLAPPFTPHSCEASWLWSVPNGSLHFEQGRNVSFAGCTFRHLGSPSALSFMGGAHGNRVSSCHFYDLSGSAVQVGRNDKWAPDLADDERELYNTVEDSLVEWAANEFHGAVGVQVSHAQHTVLDRLELRNLTYGGVSVGWGWARHALNGTYSSHNRASRIHVHHFKTLLGDGGGIYALGPQPHSEMASNWLHDMHAGRGGGAYYPDEGSTDWSIHDAVFSDAAACTDRCEWLHIWTSSIINISVSAAWTDTAVQENHGTNCSVTNVSVVKKGAFPPRAQAIMAAAGPTTRFPAWAHPPAPPAPLWLPLAKATRAAAVGGWRDAL